MTSAGDEERQRVSQEESREGTSVEKRMGKEVEGIGMSNGDR